MRTPFFDDMALDQRLDEFIERLAGGLGRSNRVDQFSAYLTGLLSDGDRKSVEPMAARTAPGHLSSEHQSLLHFVSDAAWSDERMLRAARDYALPEIERSGAIDVWIIDDTSIVKKGTESVGVARQYCGRLGKQENCQVAVTLSVANSVASLPVAYQLYLSESWIKDRKRREKTHVPETVVFRTKPEIALDQITNAVSEGVPRGVVLADAGYGGVTEFRDGLTARGITYLVEIKNSTAVWLETAGRPPAKRGGRKAYAKTDQYEKPRSVRELAMGLPKVSFRRIQWREGASRPLVSRFAAVRVRAAHGHTSVVVRREPEWLLIEWPAGESEPTKYSLSTLPLDATLRRLVVLNKSRWRIERDYEELKGELGLHHFEGRSWRGFHHHGSLCIAAYAFLAAEPYARGIEGTQRVAALGLHADHLGAILG